MADPLFHVADAAEWAVAREAGRYERSTRGRSLAEVGYVHLATADQWPGVLDRFFAGHEGTLLLLTIDARRLTAPLRWEAPHPGSDERFPTSTARSTSTRSWPPGRCDRVAPRGSRLTRAS